MSVYQSILVLRFMPGRYRGYGNLQAKLAASSMLPVP